MYTLENEKPSRNQSIYLHRRHSIFMQTKEMLYIRFGKKFQKFRSCCVLIFSVFYKDVVCVSVMANQVTMNNEHKAIQINLK